MSDNATVEYSSQVTHQADGVDSEKAAVDDVVALGETVDAVVDVIDEMIDDVVPQPDTPVTTPISNTTTKDLTHTERDRKKDINKFKTEMVVFGNKNIIDVESTDTTQTMENVSFETTGSTILLDPQQSGEAADQENGYIMNLLSDVMEPPQTKNSNNKLFCCI